MTETATAPNSSVLRKKVLGVPVLYLAGGFVVILVAIAWKTKSAASPAAATDPNATDTAPAASDTILSEGTTPPLPVGTVTAPAPSTDTANSSIETNDEWLSRGVATLIKMGYGPGDAQLALSLYLDGAELSYEQGKMRDSAIRENGLPPYPVNIGGTRPDVGRTQGPLPRAHIVKNTAESTAAKLASLYYNRSDAFAITAITTANGGRASYNVGDSVTVPVLPSPGTAKPPAKPAVPAHKPPVAKPHAPVKRYYTVKRGDTLSGIAYRYYHNASKYPVIQHANGIKDPNKITVGQRLLIP